ncbi:fimbria/pilus outer membrane usher protein [Luteimonas sp. C4P040a]|nr:fimbria/pilus outer membrane usher protein [Luteimonas fraxinea]
MTLAISEAHARVPEGVEPLLLLPTVDGQEKRTPAVFWQHKGAWHAEAKTWAALGVVLKPEETGVLPAAALGVGFDVDEGEAVVHVTIPADRLPTQEGARRGRSSELSPAAPGVLVNYSISGLVSGVSQGASMGFDARTAGRWGVVSTTGQFNARTGQGGEFRRGVTRWQRDDLDRQVTWQAGDVFAGSSREIVGLGGVRVARDPRALDPTTPTYPVPFLGGIALDPGTVEVLANEARVLRQDVGRGPFVVNGNPLSTGASRTQVVVRDAYGRESVLSDQRFYVAPTLLRQGLTTWDVALGRVREDESTYGTLGASGNVAWGFNDRWTLRAGGQADEHQQGHLTLGATTALGTFGTLDVEAGHSSGGGWRWGIAYDYQGPEFGVRLEHERNDRFWRLRSRVALDIQERTRASVSWRPHRDLSLRAGYTALQTDRTSTHFADAGVTLRRGAHQFGAGVVRDFERQETRLDLGYQLALGQQRIAARVRSAPEADVWALRYAGSIDVQETPVSVAAEIEDGSRGREARGVASWVTDVGQARVSAGSGYGTSYASGTFTGAVHVDRQGLSFLRPASSAFAVIDVPGQANVPVRVGGRVVGRTNAKGRLVTGEVGALIPTQVRLDDRALPLGVQLGDTEKTAMSGRLAGMHVSFPVRTNSARTFRVTGVAIAPGTRAKTEREETQVGFDGVVYLEHSEPGQAIDVEGVCMATVPNELGPALDVTPLPCR